MAKNEPDGTGRYIKMPSNKQDYIKGYTPNKKLINLLRTQLYRRKETQAGRESPEDKKERRNTDKKKVYYLDKIFKAMADLAFFFEAIAKHPELEDLYEDDIKDLLGIRRKKPSDESKPGPLCGFMFHNLLYNILKVSGSPFEKREIVNDFRLILNHRAEEIVKMKVRRSLRSGQYRKDASDKYVEGKSKGGILETISKEANVHGVILDDFDRALAWTEMLASRVDNSTDYDTDYEEEPRRTFDFDTEDLLGIKKEENQQHYFP
jgi:hypothetical protein